MSYVCLGILIAMILGALRNWLISLISIALVALLARGVLEVEAVRDIAAPAIHFLGDKIALAADLLKGM